MEIGGWLRSLGLERYEAAFRENGVDETVLPKLTAEDLKDLGVTAVGHRRRSVVKAAPYVILCGLVRKVQQAGGASKEYELGRWEWREAAGDRSCTAPRPRFHVALTALGQCNSFAQHHGMAGCLTCTPFTARPKTRRRAGSSLRTYEGAANVLPIIRDI
jgi:hypothetical protein